MRIDDPISLSLRRRAFFAGFAVTITICALVALIALGSGHLSTLARAAAQRAYEKINPVRINVEAARQRLRRAAGIDAAVLTFPFPRPRLVVCKENKILDLFHGERFIKRYKVTLGTASEGTFLVATHDLPRGDESLVIGLCKPPVPPATASAIPTTHTASAPAAIPTVTCVIRGINKGQQAAADIALGEDEAAELFAATAPGSPVVIEP